MIGWQRNHHRRIPTNNVARIRSKSIEKRVLVVEIVLSLRIETDNAQFEIIEKYFSGMFRRLQFTFPEGAIFISCVDQKLLTLEEMMDSL